MADQLITQLTQLPEGSVEATDVLPIVDISASETKKVTAKDLFEAGAALADASSIDLAKLDQTSTTKLGTTAFADAAVTYDKIQNVSTTDRLIGRSSAGAGIVEEITCTAAGRALLDGADAAAQRTTLGLGTIATQDAASVAITGGTVTGGTITGITDLAVADGGTGASDAATARTNLGIVIGADVQAFDASLQSISDLSLSADQTIYATAADTFAVANLSAYGRSLIDDADAVEARTTLGLGSLSTQDGTFSGTHSGTTSGTNTGDQTIELTGDVTGTGTGSFATTIATDAVTADKILNGAVGTDELAAGAVTGAKLAADSSTVVSGNAPSGSGEFEGQQWFNSNTGLEYIWDGTAWQQLAGVQSFEFTDSTPLAFSASVLDGVATITSTLEDQSANAVLAGPTTGSATAPTFRALTSADLPVGAAGTPGALSPGTGLSVAAGGVLNHANVISTGTFTKVTIDTEGHVSDGGTLEAEDIPDLDASKITTGTFSSAFLAENSVTASQLADYGIAQVSETAPTPEFAGQWWINPADRAAYIWVGTVSPTLNGYWLLVGYGSASQINLRFGGTYNASTNEVVTLNSYGTEAGLTVGQSLTSPNQQNNGVYLIVTTTGTGTTPAPTTNLAVGDWILSLGSGSNWIKIAVVSGAAGVLYDYDILCDGTYFTPDIPNTTDVRDALQQIWEGRCQIATTSQLGVVLESTEVLVNNSTGAMTIGVVDDGTY